MLRFPDTRLLGSALILAGTSIGAGMLALPLVSSEMGFLPTVALFSVVAFFMAVCALLIYEANLIVGKGSSMYVMAGSVFGRPGKQVATVATLWLFYALLAAYLSGGGELVHHGFKSLSGTDIAPQWGVMVFALLTSGVVFYSTRAVDYTNRLLFLFMLIAFWGGLILLMPSVKSDFLVTKTTSYSSLVVALPIIFTSFGYHGSVPSIILYQKDNTKGLPVAFFVGTLLVLIVYILWLIASLGNLSAQTLASLSGTENSISQLIAGLSEVVSQRGNLNRLLLLFSDLALMTSVLGVALGVFDYLASVFHREDTRWGRAQTVLFTFLPPVAFALLYPHGFVVALGYAAIALAILAVLLPVAIVWVLRERKEKNSYRVSGGKPMLLACLAFGMVIICAQCFVISNSP